jgi:large subunit ribosomal protein L21
MNDQSAPSESATPYAVVCNGGRQYRVTEGMILDIDYREGLETGSEVVFDRVLALSDGTSFRLGTPALAGVAVSAKVVGVAKGDKIYIQKFRRRKNSKRRTGHRQKYTRIEFGKLPS